MGIPRSRDGRRAGAVRRHGGRVACGAFAPRIGAISLLSLAALASLAGAPCVAEAADVPRFSREVGLHVGVDPFRMVAADLNGDRKPDLATVDWTSSTVSVLLGKGTGSFRKRIAYRTARHPAGITVSDVNSDGNPDLVSASVDRAGSISVFLNRGSGRFRRAGNYASGARAYAVAAGDINQDGTVDLVTANDTRNHFAVLLGQGAGRFAIAHRYTGGNSTDVALGDLNVDGKLDIALSTVRGAQRNSIAVRLGNGDGTFGPEHAFKSGSAPFDVMLADVNHDDKLDIAAANYGGSSVSVFLGTGDGTFGARSQFPMGEIGFNVDAVVAADFDRDGHLDIATPELFGPIVRRGRGDGTFLGQQNVADDLWTGGGAAVADFNRDGWPDLAFSGTCDGPDCSWKQVYVLLNWTGQPAPPCVVVDIRRLTLHEASGALGDTGCRLGRVGHRYSRKVRKGRVISQRPRDGAVLPSHGRVDVVVSRGRRR